MHVTIDYWLMLQTCTKTGFLISAESTIKLSIIIKRGKNLGFFHFSARSIKAIQHGRVLANQRNLKKEIKKFSDYDNAKYGTILVKENGEPRLGSAVLLGPGGL